LRTTALTNTVMKNIPCRWDAVTRHHYLFYCRKQFTDVVRFHETYCISLWMNFRTLFQGWQCGLSIETPFSSTSVIIYRHSSFAKACAFRYSPSTLRTRVRHTLCRQPYGKEFPPAYGYRKYIANRIQ
jgi:hypothetical protein